jgi:hypothetical protein
MRRDASPRRRQKAYAKSGREGNTLSGKTLSASRATMPAEHWALRRYFPSFSTFCFSSSFICLTTGG